MRTDVITLVTQTTGVDSYGDITITETTRQVYCRVASIGQKEFYQAASLGLQPEIKFILTDYYDYNDEKVIIYDTKRYHVLRTYRTDNALEIIAYSEVNAS